MTGQPAPLSPETPAADLLERAGTDACNGVPIRDSLTGQPEAMQAAAYGALASLLKPDGDAVQVVWTWDTNAHPLDRALTALAAALIIRKSTVTA